jgi:hypothetical protein
VQVAFAPECGVAWRLEWRTTQADGTYVHYFAHEPGDMANVVHHVEHVVVAFKAFYIGDGPPDQLIWCRYNI